jgi:hypothetical protein
MLALSFGVLAEAVANHIDSARQDELKTSLRDIGEKPLKASFSSSR